MVEAVCLVLYFTCVRFCFLAPMIVNKGRYSNVSTVCASSSPTQPNSIRQAYYIIGLSSPGFLTKKARGVGCYIFKSDTNANA